MDIEFQKVLFNDIEKCQEVLKSNDISCLRNLEFLLYNKYIKVIEGLECGLEKNIDGDVNIAKRNVEFLKERIELYWVLIRQKEVDEDLSRSRIEINNSSSSKSMVKSSNSVKIKVSFLQVCEEIEKMSMLTDNDKKEIIEQINELRKVIESDSERDKKWGEAKRILFWIADKGVDVLIATIPLFLGL